MNDDRLPRLLYLLEIAGRSGQSTFPGKRPGLVTWLGQQLDEHPGETGFRHVEQLLREYLVDLPPPKALTPDEIEALKHDAQQAGLVMKAVLERQKR